MNSTAVQRRKLRELPHHKVGIPGSLLLATVVEVAAVISSSMLVAALHHPQFCHINRRVPRFPQFPQWVCIAHLQIK
jgi:hypothetical protein